jgi:hypothetical protein
MGTVAQPVDVGDSVPELHPTRWRSVHAGIWVGHRNGEFAGMIEQRRGHGYLVTTRLGKNLGLFRTMDAARRVLS